MLIAAVWLIGLAASLPFATRLRYIDDASICIVISYAPVTQFAYASCYTTVGWLLPGVILTTLYFKTAKELRTSEDYHSHAKVMQQQIRTENKQVVKMFVIVVGLFFSLTLPNAIYQIVHHYIYFFGNETARQKVYLGQIYTVLPCLSAMNSCINPLVYAKMQKEVNRYVRSWVGAIRRVACLHTVQESETASSIRQESTKMEVFAKTNTLLARADEDCSKFYDSCK